MCKIACAIQECEARSAGWEEDMGQTPLMEQTLLDHHPHCPSGTC